jgi:hypothetical protein
VNSLLLDVDLMVPVQQDTSARRRASDSPVALVFILPAGSALGAQLNATLFDLFEYDGVMSSGISDQLLTCTSDSSRADTPV